MICLFATPGMAKGAHDAAAPFREAGIRVAWVPIAGTSRVFVEEAHRRRDASGRVLPGLLRKWAPGARLDEPVLFVGFSAGCWLWREGIALDDNDRDQTVGCVFIDGLHATAAQLTETEVYLEDGGRVLNIHSDTPTHGYPSTTETVATLGPHDGLTTVHRPGGHHWGTLRAAHAIRQWLVELDLRPEKRPTLSRPGDFVPRRTWPGDRGAQVTAWQELLQVGGYYSGPLDGSHGPKTEAATVHYLSDIYDPGEGLSLAERCCEWLGHQWALDPREIRGARHHQLIVSYSEHCRRGGKLLGIDHDGLPLWRGGVPLRAPSDEWAWCAAFQSACLLACLEPGERPPHGLRVAVRELVEDAREQGTLHLAGSGYEPKPGDLAATGRAGESPLRGGRGHVDCLLSRDDRWGQFMGGNEGDRIQLQRERLDSKDAWIAR